MRLIIEKVSGRIFVYFEDEEHYQNVKNNRGTTEIDVQEAERILDNECDMSFFPDNTHFVVDIKE